MIAGKEDKEVEIKLKTFGSEATKKAVYVLVNACSSKDHAENIVGVCFIGQDITGQKVVMDKFTQIQGDYKTVVHSPNPLIPPIFASDENTCCSEWNMAMEKLTGCSEQEIKGKLLVGEVFGGLCRLKGPDALTKFMIVLHNAILGKEIEKFPFSFFNKNGTFVQALLTANPRSNMDGKVVGVFCFLQIASPELQQGMEMQKQLEKKCLERIKELAYICWEIKNPLSGIRFVNSMLEGTDMSNEQKQLLETSIACEKQAFRIVQNMDCINNG